MACTVMASPIGEERDGRRRRQRPGQPRGHPLGRGAEQTGRRRWPTARAGTPRPGRCRRRPRDGGAGDSGWTCPRSRSRCTDAAQSTTVGAGRTTRRARRRRLVVVGASADAGARRIATPPLVVCRSMRAPPPLSRPATRRRVCSPSTSRARSETVTRPLVQRAVTSAWVPSRHGQPDAAVDAGQRDAAVPGPAPRRVPAPRRRWSSGRRGARRRSAVRGRRRWWPSPALRRRRCRAARRRSRCAGRRAPRPAPGRRR